MSGEVLINELLIQPDGPLDSQQFFELKGTASQSLAGFTFVTVSGEGNFSGELDQWLDLSPWSLGSNGLLEWRNVPGPPLNPGPDPATTQAVAGFDPGFVPTFLDNESQTFLIVEGFDENISTDIDADNDGILDGPLPWSRVVDAIGIREDDATPGNEFAFGEQLGFTDFDVLGFDPDAIFRDRSGGHWFAADVVGPPFGPYLFDPTEVARPDGSTFAVTRPVLTHHS